MIFNNNFWTFLMIALEIELRMNLQNSWKSHKFYILMCSDIKSWSE